MLLSAADVGKCRSQVSWAYNKMMETPDRGELPWDEGMLHLREALRWLEDYKYCRKYDAKVGAELPEVDDGLAA